MERRVIPLTERGGSDVSRAVVEANDSGPYRRKRLVGPLMLPETLSALAAGRSGAKEMTRQYRLAAASTSRATCPFCRGSSFARSDGGQDQCAHCGRAVMLLQEESESNPSVAVPVIYGHYRAIRLAGQGGMGLVMYGMDEERGQPGAIKLLIEPDQLRQRTISRFHREVAALRSISHPNIVRLLSHGTVGNQRFLVMDWVQGPTIRDLIDVFHQRHELPALELIRSWLIQTCSGLAAIHCAGVVHRDIKPSNLMLDHFGIVRIADFGIARLSADHELPPPDGAEPRATAASPAIGSPFSLPLTVAGEFTGTFNYMAPECFRSEFACSPRSDLYSLGVTFYEIATGKRPLFAYHPPSVLNRSLPEAFDDVITRLMAKNPRDRFSSAEQVASALSGAT